MISVNTRTDAEARELARSLPLEAIDVSDPALFRDDTVGHYFERLRDECPVHRGHSERFGDFWSVTRFDDIRRVVDDRLGAVQGRPSFMRGGVTISSLTPLRWVPHRVIVMLGMDAEVLTSGTTDGDDLAAAEPLVGDRDRRGELRQSMLETVLSAGDHLVLIRNGHDVRTNQPVPMPVAVAELRDAVLARMSQAQRERLASDPGRTGQD